MTTIGYGDTDNKGKESQERLFLMVAIFVGIAMFTIITDQVKTYRIEVTVEHLVVQNTEAIHVFLNQLSMTRKTRTLNEEIYNECIEVIEESLRYSTKATF